MNKIVSAELHTDDQWLNFEISKFELIIFFAKIALLVGFLTAPVFFALISSRGYSKFGWCQHLLKIFGSTISSKYRLR